MISYLNPNFWKLILITHFQKFDLWISVLKPVLFDVKSENKLRDTFICSFVTYLENTKKIPRKFSKLVFLILKISHRKIWFIFGKKLKSYLILVIDFLLILIFVEISSLVSYFVDWFNKILFLRSWCAFDLPWLIQV